VSYPILVTRLRGYQAYAIICERCGVEAKLDPDDLNQDGCWPCPDDCGGTAVFKYQEAPRCPNCGELGLDFSPAWNGCCSRPCMLQWAYAQEVWARRGRLPDDGGNVAA
jgi:hypothetical protein